MTPDALPLAGLRVAVTRAEEDAGELEVLLRQVGAEAVLLPLTRTHPPRDAEPLRRALADAGHYDWIVFTSPRAVRAVRAAGGLQPRAGLRGRIAAVGPATALVLHSLTGLHPDAVPAVHTGGDIVPAMLAHGPLAGRAVLWPRAEQARRELPDALARAGAVLDDPVAYRTAADPDVAAKLAGLAAAGEVDVITFAAPSAVECFADAGGHPAACIIAVIGPTTAAAARAHGLPVHVAAEQPVMAGLVAALVRYHVGRSG